MNSNHFEENICRICLGDNVWLDWNTTLYQFYDMTYKDCYYKYSQLERYATDPFPQMLCQNCSNSLYNTHVLILKALESQKFLQNEFSFNGEEVGEIKTSTRISQVNDINFIPAEFETVLIEKFEIEPIIDEHLKYEENSDELVAAKPNQTKNSITESENVQFKVKTTQSVKTKNKFRQFLKNPSNNSSEIHKSSTQTKRECTTRIKEENAVEGNICKRVIDTQYGEKEKSAKCESIKYNVMYCDERKEENDTAKAEPNMNKKYRETDEPRMCSMCSKILRNKYAVQLHEKTHMENRERKETCKVCGLKFYDKRNLYSHMRIHKENREKRHKCEFCNKAFYDKGGLNIHRRIHLGQMIPCTLCSKQFFRQIDLDRHMSSHSATAINSDTKKRSRYFVRCEYCDKSILSTSFKSHTAAHLNQPLMKCSICGKEYFRRKSCVLHVKKAHQKTNDEYNDFIVIYKNNRISHLYLKQNADILADND